MLARRKSSFRDLLAWQKACDLAVAVYGLTADFPKRETYGITAQMRDCATSIAANIAEGRARKGDRDFLRFLHISAGSLAELETFTEISRRLGYVDPSGQMPLQEEVDEVGRLLSGLIRSVRSSIGDCPDAR